VVDLGAFQTWGFSEIRTEWRDYRKVDATKPNVNCAAQER
jgi:hypothetical protein